METHKFYLDVGFGEVRCHLTLKGVAKYSATSGWTNASVEKAVETRRFEAQQIVQKCDEWLEAWRRQH